MRCALVATLRIFAGEFPHVKLYLKLKPEQVIISDIVRDVTNLGHWGTGDIEVVVHNQADLAKAKLLIEQAYQEN